jgi:hypothetical protein
MILPLAGLRFAWVMRMADQKTAKNEDGKGVPPPAEPARVWDPRLFPGGSPDAARLHIGVNAVDPDAMWIDDVIVGGVKSTS